MKSCTIPAPSFPRNENHKVLKQRWRHFTSLKLCQCSQIPQPPPRVTSTFNRMKTTIIGLIIYKYSTLTSIHHLARQMTEGNFGLTFVPHSLNLTPETKRRNLRLPSAFISFSYTSNTEKDSSTRQAILTPVTNSRAVAHKNWMAEVKSKTSCSPSILSINFMTTRKSQIVPYWKLNTDLCVGSPQL